VRGSRTYQPSLADVNKMVTVTYTPVRDDGVAGDPVSSALLVRLGMLLLLRTLTLVLRLTGGIDPEVGALCQAAKAVARFTVVVPALGGAEAVIVCYDKKLKVQKGSGRSMSTQKLGKVPLKFVYSTLKVR